MNMLIKLNDNLCVNPDHVAGVHLDPDHDTIIITMSSGAEYEMDPAEKQTAQQAMEAILRDVNTMVGRR